MADSSKRRASTKDVALAQTLGRYEMGKRFINVLYIVAAALVVFAIKYPTEALAGKHTDVTLKFSITIAISVALGGSLVALWAKNRAQGRELVRLRKRCTDLEAELSQAKKAGVK